MNKAQKLESIKDARALSAVAEQQNKSFTVLGKGTNIGKLENGVLAPNGQSIIVEGQAGTEGVIPGIKNIRLNCKPGILYDFTIEVEGKCPEGKWDNRMEFTDQDGDTYTLRIYSETAKTHTVNYHSPNGAINKITWDI